MKIKSGVQIDKLVSQIVIACAIVEQIYTDLGYECVLTSGNDGMHSKNSLHYVGKAVDFRTRNIEDANTKHKLKRLCAEALGENYDVVLEGDHLHVEYDPK